MFGVLRGMLLTISCLGAASGLQGAPELLTKPENGSVLVTQTHVFRCRATGTPPLVYTWHKFDTPLPDRGQNYYVTSSGFLSFEEVSINDTGKYQCIVRNALGEVRSDYVHLHVYAPARIIRGPSERRVPRGTVVHLECVSIGVPRTNIEWFKDGDLLPSRGVHGPRTSLNVTVTETATYQCRAFNNIMAAVYEDRKEAQVQVMSDHEARRMASVCLAYNGSTCASHLGSRSIYFDTSTVKSIVDLDANLAKLLADLAADAYCREPLEKLLCSVAFPDCYMSKDEHARKRSVCHTDCLAVSSLFCTRLWPVLEQWLDTSPQKFFSLPTCSDVDKKSLSKNCIDLKFYDPKPGQITSDCYLDDGRYYVGMLNVTKQGLSCQKWAQVAPHAHADTPDLLPELREARNYCRNPGARRKSPWCYTTHRRITWQYCALPRCDNLPGNVSDIVITNTTLTFKQSELHDNLISIVIYSVVAIMALGVLVLASAVCRYLQQRHQTIRYDVSPQTDYDDVNMSLSAIAVFPTPYVQSKLQKLEYPREDVIFIRDIAQGAFGRVFQAKCPNLGTEKTTIAVKVLREDATEEMQLDFVREATLLADFNHANIVKLLGICTAGKPLCLLLEYMAKGDLNEYLRSCSPEVRRASLTDDTPKNSLKCYQKIYIAKQVAAGMVYLVQKRYVHRDLASRNCLVGENMRVRIADFGMARKMQTDNLYRGNEDEAIPIRWMPLEAILFNKFMEESDVWSFGVLVWEIFSYGEQPYAGRTHEQVIRHILDGNYLPRPHNTPDLAYELMKRCWSKQPSKRPNFRRIQPLLSVLEKESTIYDYAVSIASNQSDELEVKVR